MERYPIVRIADRARREEAAMPSHAADLARRLARNAEAVCRHYLSNGHREGRYWLVGDVSNTRGRSLFVRLSGPDHGKGAAGKWTDAATGEHGDLLDLIALSRGLDRLRDTLEEARCVPCRCLLAQLHGRTACRRRVARPSRRAVSMPCPGRSRARSRKPTCAVVASSPWLSATRCASIRAATIAPTRTARPRPGRR